MFGQHVGQKRDTVGGEDGQRAGKCRLCLASRETGWRRGEAFPRSLSVKVPPAFAAGTRSRGRWRARSPATLADVELAQPLREIELGRRIAEKKRRYEGAGSRWPHTGAAPTQFPVPA